MFFAWNVEKLGGAWVEGYSSCVCLALPLGGATSALSRVVFVVKDILSNVMSTETVYYFNQLCFQAPLQFGYAAGGQALLQ